MSHSLDVSVSFTQNVYTVYENEVVAMIGVMLHLEQNATVERDIMVNLVQEENSPKQAQSNNGMSFERLYDMYVVSKGSVLEEVYMLNHREGLVLCTTYG